MTSYGKNIAPQKIEMLLKAMDGVSEAMVVAAAVADLRALDEAIEAANARLSHPEQVKRWIVAVRPLTIAAWELTPNLKVRRSIVEGTRADLIEELYARDFETRASGSPDVAHRGWAR